MEYIPQHVGCRPRCAHNMQNYPLPRAMSCFPGSTFIPRSRAHSSSHFQLWGLGHSSSGRASQFAPRSCRYPNTHLSSSPSVLFARSIRSIVSAIVLQHLHVIFNAVLSPPAILYYWMDAGQWRGWFSFGGTFSTTEDGFPQTGCCFPQQRDRFLTTPAPSARPALCTESPVRIPARSQLIRKIRTDSAP